MSGERKGPAGRQSSVIARCFLRLQLHVGIRASIRWIQNEQPKREVELVSVAIALVAGGPLIFEYEYCTKQ